MSLRGSRRPRGQETLSIVDCIRDGRYAFEDEVIGIVSPTYFWGLPSIVGEFLGKASSDARQGTEFESTGFQQV